MLPNRLQSQIDFEMAIMKFLGVDHINNIQSISIHSSVDHAPYAVITKIIGDGFHDDLSILETKTFNIKLEEVNE